MLSDLAKLHLKAITGFPVLPRSSVDRFASNKMSGGYLLGQDIQGWIAGHVRRVIPDSNNGNTFGDGKTGLIDLKRCWRATPAFDSWLQTLVAR